MTKSRFWTRALLFLNVLAAVALICSYLATHISPFTFWPIAFFGLAYPGILLLNFIFIAWWIWRKRRKYALLSIVIVLAGFGHLLDFFQISTSGGQSHENSSQVKILSYNVRLFDLYNWSENKSTRNGIFNFLTKEDPDIICFQEFYYTDRDNYFETKDTLVTFLRANNIFEKNRYIAKGKQHFGIATFSSYPILHSGEVDFGDDLVNRCIFTDLLIDDSEIVRVYNAHLASIKFSGEDYEFFENPQGQNLKSGSRKIGGRLKRAFLKRAYQTEQVMNHIKESPYPVIVCGDFNDTPVSYCYSEFSSVLVDAFKESGNGIGNTYVGVFPSFRIDYIFHSEELLSYQFNTHSEKLSDHHPVSCMIEIP